MSCGLSDTPSDRTYSGVICSSVMDSFDDSSRWDEDEDEVEVARAAEFVPVCTTAEIPTFPIVDGRPKLLLPEHVRRQQNRDGDTSDEDNPAMEAGVLCDEGAAKVDEECVVPEDKVTLAEEQPSPVEEQPSLAEEQPSPVKEQPSEENFTRGFVLTNKVSRNEGQELHQLSGVVNLLRALTMTPEADEVVENKMGIHKFLLSSAEDAVKQANEVRAGHPGCKSLCLSYQLIVLATKMAHFVADTEDRDGLTEELAMLLSTNHVQHHLRDMNDLHLETRKMGMAIGRLSQGIDYGNNLPLESVNFWYQIGKLQQRETDKSEMTLQKYKKFLQLLDPESQFMGWGAAYSTRGRAAYAVALFDHSAVASWSALDSLKPAAEQRTSSRVSPANTDASEAKWFNRKLTLDECRYVNSTLQPVRRLRLAVADLLLQRGRSKEQETATMYFIIEGAESAARQANRLRQRHLHCRAAPLSPSCRLLQMAAEVACELATREDGNGPDDDYLLSRLGARSLRATDEGKTRKLGFAACRISDPSAWSSFKDLAMESVNRWYSASGSYQYGYRQCPEKYGSFIQLLDPISQYLGWGAAMCDSGDAVYAVALFDHPGAEDHRIQASLLPPMDDAAATSLGQLGEASNGFFELVQDSMNCGAVAHLSGVTKLLIGRDAVDALKDDAASSLVSLTKPAAALLTDLAAAAVQRVNHLRYRYRHCPCVPLALNRTLCLFAAARANEMALQEDRSGLTGELRAALQDNCLVLPRLGQKMGLVACRLARWDDPHIGSVNVWYKEASKTYPYGKPEAAMQEARYRRFVQLLDGKSRHMGWGAAVTNSGSIFAVALFDSVGSTNRKYLEKLRPSDRCDSDQERD